MIWWPSWLVARPLTPAPAMIVLAGRPPEFARVAGQPERGWITLLYCPTLVRPLSPKSRDVCQLEASTDAYVETSDVQWYNGRTVKAPVFVVAS